MQIKIGITKIFLIFSILLICLLHILMYYLNNVKKDISSETDEDITKIIMENFQEKLNRTVLLNYDDIKVYFPDHHNNLNFIDKNNFCAKIFYDNKKTSNQIELYQNKCSLISYDLNGSKAPIMPDKALRVKYEGKKIIVTQAKYWYNYDNSEVAIIAFVNNPSDYGIGSVVRQSDIKRVMIWVPRFFYNEDSGSFSYKSEVGMSLQHDKTTISNLPYIFFYKNRELYGYWVDIYNNAPLDNNDINHLSNSKILKINQDIIDSFEIFMKNYGGKKYEIIDTSQVIVIGMGLFYEKEY